MPIIKLHYDGWLVLPAGLRQALRLNSGDRLSAELVDGALVLRPAPSGRRVIVGKAAASTGNQDEPEPAAARRKVGRPRKPVPVKAAKEDAPKRPRGRPRKVVQAAAIETTPAAALDLGPPLLRKKTARDIGTAEPVTVVPAVQPALAARPERAFQPAEHRPFRNVEVRQLGPGRGHNRDRGPRTGPRNR